MGTNRAQLASLVLAAFLAAAAAGCPVAPPNAPVTDDTSDSDGSQEVRATPTPAPKSVISGQVVAPATGVIANNTLVAPFRLGFRTQALEQPGVEGAEVSLLDADGLTLGKPVMTDASGSFGFPEVPDAVGTFYVAGKFSAAGGSFELRAILRRQADEAASVIVDVPSTLVAEKVSQLQKLGKLELSEVDADRLALFAARLREKLAKEQVPLMVAGSQDIFAQLDEILLDDLELRGLAAATHKKLASPTDGWAVSTLYDSSKPPPDVSVADLGLAGSFAADKDGNLYMPTYPSAGSVKLVRARTSASPEVLGTLSNSRAPVVLAFGADGTLHAADFREDERQLRLFRGLPPSLVATMSWPSGGAPEPSQMAIDGAGRAFVALPSHHVVVVMTPNSTTSLIVGGAGSPGFKDESASAARFSRPSGVAVGPNGSCWVADRDNNVLRKIAADGAVSTVAGGAGDGIFRAGRASFARFGSPVSLAIKGGTVFVADAGAHRVRRLSLDGMVFTVAGSATASAGDGVGDVAGFSRLEVLSADDRGALYVRDAQVNSAGNVTGYLIRKIARP